MPMCVIATFIMTCPKCGHKFFWCNGGDVIVSRSQLFPTCPNCKYESIANEFNPSISKSGLFNHN